MDDRELVGAIALRANVSENEARAALDALRDLVREGRVRAEELRPGSGSPADPAAVDALIAAARLHPLGLEFLRHGWLGSVAAEFHAHAFTVEAARERLDAEARDAAEVVECR